MSKSKDYSKNSILAIAKPTAEIPTYDFDGALEICAKYIARYEILFKDVSTSLYDLIKRFSINGDLNKVKQLEIYEECKSWFFNFQKCYDYYFFVYMGHKLRLKHYEAKPHFIPGRKYFVKKGIGIITPETSYWKYALSIIMEE
jgi:hypothetical protein